MSAPLMVTRPGSGATKPSRISITVDLPAPDGPASTRVSPAGHAERQPVQRRPARGIPGQAHVLERDGDALRRHRADLARRLPVRAAAADPAAPRRRRSRAAGPGRRRRSRAAARRTPAPATARTTRCPDCVTAVREQRHAVTDRQHDQRQGGREVQRGRRQKRHAQHAHGAAAQFIGGGGERRRLPLGPAIQHDGGDAAHAVEEPRLQPRHRQELVARGGGGADAGSAIAIGTSSPHGQHERRERIGPQRRQHHEQRAGDRQRWRRQPAREQPVQRLHPIDHGGGQFAGMAAPQLRRARHAATASARRSRSRRRAARRQ